MWISEPSAAPQTRRLRQLTGQRGELLDFSGVPALWLPAARVWSSLAAKRACEQFLARNRPVRGMRLVRASRILVIRPYDGRGLATFAVFPGCVCGILFNVVLPGSLLSALSPLFRWPAVAALVLIPIIYGLATAFSVLRLRTTACLGAVSWSSMFVSITIFNVLSSSDGGAFLIVNPLKSFFFPVLVGSSIFGMIGALLHTGLFVARRAWVFELIEDDGGHCLRCGYEIGSTNIVRCPECGESVSNRRYRWHWYYSILSWSRRRAGVMLAAFLVAASLPAGWIIATRTVPAAPFMWRFRDGKYLAGTSVSIWLDKEAQRALVLTYDWRHLPDTDALTAYEGRPYTVGSDSGIDPGNPWITWVFSRTQAEYVLKHGLPASFLRELDETRASYDANPGQTALGTRLRLNVSFDPADDPG